MLIHSATEFHVNFNCLSFSLPQYLSLLCPFLLLFIISISQTFSNICSVGEAIANVDYTPFLDQTVRFGRNGIDPLTNGANDRPFTILITNDEITEGDEHFYVFFDVVVNAVPFPGRARITIEDDDTVGLRKLFILVCCSILLYSGNSLLLLIINIYVYIIQYICISIGEKQTYLKEADLWRRWSSPLVMSFSTKFDSDTQLSVAIPIHTSSCACVKLKMPKMEHRTKP